MKGGIKKLGESTVVRYILRRLLALIPVLLGVTFITYGLMYISPKDPVEMMLVEAMRHQLGLDRPFLVQYFTWLWNFLRGDMGVSYIDGKSVSAMLLTAIPNTLKLAIGSVLVTVVVSVPLGIYTAVKQGKFSDALIRFLSFISQCDSGIFAAQI